MDNEVPKGVKESFTTLAKELEIYIKQSPSQKEPNQVKTVNTAPIPVAPVQPNPEPKISPNLLPSRITVLIGILFIMNLFSFFYIILLERRISQLESLYKPNTTVKTEL